MKLVSETTLILRAIQCNIPQLKQVLDGGAWKPVGVPIGGWYACDWSYPPIAITPCGQLRCMWPGSPLKSFGSR